MDTVKTAVLEHEHTCSHTQRALNSLEATTNQGHQWDMSRNSANDKINGDKTKVTVALFQNLASGLARCVKRYFSQVFSVLLLVYTALKIQITKKMILLWKWLQVGIW